MTQRERKEQAAKPRSRKRIPNNHPTTAFRVSDELWAVLQPLLPVPVNTHRFGGVRPRVPDRQCADAIFFVLRTGCQWQALNQTNLCAHSTAHDRFQEWVKAGVFLKLWQAGIEQFDELCGIGWDWLAMDGAMSKAPLGGDKTGPNPTDRGKSGVKRNVITEGHGVPLAVMIEGANRHDMKLTRPTLAEIVVERPAPTEAKPQGMCLDKGYDYDEVRDILHEFGFTAHICARGEEAKEGGRVQSAPVGSRTHALMDESALPTVYSMGQKARELSRLSPFCLRIDCFSRCWVIRIGSNSFRCSGAASSHDAAS